MMYDINKTLFVTDLDGTLLHSSCRLMPDVAARVEALVNRGVKLAFATARSYYSAMKVIGELKADIPLILHNGVFIRDSISGEYILKNLIPNPDRVRAVCEQCGLNPFVYTMSGDVQKYTYMKDKITPEAVKYNLTRIGDPRDNPITDESLLWQGDIFYVLCIDNGEGAKRAYEMLKEDYGCLYGAEHYSGDMWFEAHSPNASKAVAMRKLADIMGCERIVAFGDGNNDVSMFKSADEAYAVSGAVPALKELAAALIGSNDDGAVVDFIERNTAN